MKARLPTSPLLVFGLAVFALVGGTPGALAHTGERGGERPERSEDSRLGFAETQRVLGAARSVLKGVKAGPPVLILTPQGKRLTLPLLHEGRVVTRAFLASGGQLVALTRGVGLPEPSDHALSTAELDRVAAQVQALTLSGAVQATRGEYRLSLLSAGVPVATLRLDRRTLAPRPDPGVLGRPLPPDAPSYRPDRRPEPRP